jgi:hypothetical protein
VVAKGGAGIRYNEHIEGDGEAIFRHACKLRLEGIVSNRKGLALPLWAVARLAQVQKPGRACGEAGGEEDWEQWR